ncbi:hypothetical protein L1887_31304 [Cichorium endivia]|nr:hypothetical protein L1887_31304 [Cichorium endivia]
MAMETRSSLNSQTKNDQDFKDLGVKARMISRDNTISRRFSSSRITSFREEACKSFRSNFTISSTASSPGYTLKEEIDPSTYSFTNALKALQLRSINTWEYLSPEGFALNSKWNEAERYICNPLSGEVPVECLSSKALMNGRSFRNITNRMTMSAPLIHHSSRILPQKLANIHPIQDETDVKENKIEERLIMMMKRDVGIQSKLSESSPSPASTPSIQERSIKFNLNLDSSDSSSKSESKFDPEFETKSKLKFKEDDVGGKEETKEDDEDETKRYGCMCKRRIETVCDISCNLNSRHPMGMYGEVRILRVFKAIGEASAFDIIIHQVYVAFRHRSAAKLNQTRVMALANDEKSISKLRRFNRTSEFPLKDNHVVAANHAPPSGGRRTRRRVLRLETDDFHESLLFEVDTATDKVTKEDPRDDWFDLEVLLDDDI